jgi:hypothetical protein
MAWKQDLAKLKQQLEPEPVGVPKPPPKPVAKPTGPIVLDDEDAVFLSAMGLKPSAPRPAKPLPSEPTTTAVPVVPEPPPPETFQDAIKDLKGLKPLSKGLSDRPAPPPPSVPAIKALEIVATPPPQPVAETPKPEPAVAHPLLVTPPMAPVRFQLAAGMALDVDGVLDLRGHSAMDAMERLKDRLGDGMVLGWRSLQVTLGPDPTLHEGLMALLASGEAPMVARYAQAPVPMGGTQAWLLYFGPTPTQL